MSRCAFLCSPLLSLVARLSETNLKISCLPVSCSAARILASVMSSFLFCSLMTTLVAASYSTSAFPGTTIRMLLGLLRLAS